MRPNVRVVWYDRMSVGFEATADEPDGENVFPTLGEAKAFARMVLEGPRQAVVQAIGYVRDVTWRDVVTGEGR